MKLHSRRLSGWVLIAGLTLAVGLTSAEGLQPAPAPAQPVEAAADAGLEVLARGPVHEAFAASAEHPAPSPIVPKAPPEPIEELPPDQKPEGENVQWISGYWHWDEQRADFIWISGLWRSAPPNRIWVPGSWRNTNQGSQWASGFWQETQPISTVQPNAQAARSDIEYLPAPPQSVEAGPAFPAPDPTSVYVPGTWVWRGKYVWRPGIWVGYRAGWVWVPAHYRWSPAGYIYIEGYWDYPLATRGVMYAPIYYSRPVYLQAGFVYSPVYIVSEPALCGALFVRRGYGTYYFGDYYEPVYANSGYVCWCRPGIREVDVVVIGGGRGYYYDPLWSYYSVTYRSEPRWNVAVTGMYVGRYRGDYARPPVTLVQQNTVINNVTNVTNVNNVSNVTNNMTVVNKSVVVNNKDVTSIAMIAPARVTAQLQPEVKVQPITASARQQEATSARQTAAVGVQRSANESGIVSRGEAPIRANDRPAQSRISVPQAAVARAQSISPARIPPPSPVRAAIAAPATGTGVTHNPTSGAAPMPGQPAHPVNPQAPGQPTTTPGHPTAPPAHLPNPVLPPKPKPKPPDHAPKKD